MKKLILGFLILAVAGVETNAQTLTGTQTADSVKLLATGCYNLQGCYVVPTGKVLTIEPGTVIRCSAASNLVIERGGVIVAEGTPTNQIVFTSDQAISSRAAGDWGGISLFGKAENNEGLNATRDICVDRSFGGTMANDNSGILKYVRIEFAGDPTNRDEAAALLLASVGNLTVLDNIQITESAENGLTVLGGEPKVNTAYILNCYLNGIYANLGTKGTIDGALVMTRDANAHQSGETRGLLIENNRISNNATPLTHLKVNNSSLIGPGSCNSGPLHSDFKNGVEFDKNGGGDIYNTVITGYREYGLFINDALSAARTAIDELNCSYNSMTNNGSGDYAYGASSWSGCGSSMTDWMSGSQTCSETGNQFSPFVLGYDASFCDDYCDIDFVQNFVLTESTELNAPDPITSLYDDRGAVQFTDSFTWVTVCPQNKVYCSPEMKKEAKDKKSTLIIVPNPAQSQANLMFDAYTPGKATILILDKVTGRVLFQKSVTIKQAGEQNSSISVKGLREGVYPIQVQMKDAVINSLISVQ